MLVYGIHIPVGKAAQRAGNHPLLDGPDYSSRDRRKEKAGFLPVGEKGISGQDPAGVAGDRGGYYLPAAALVGM